MKRGKYPNTHDYAFQLTLEINSALTFSSGDVADLVVDALFALDKQGVLFPGVTNPEKRLRGASIEAVGYERSEDDALADGVYRSLMITPEPPSKVKRALRDRLWEAINTMGASVLHQRMLIAKMHGLADKCTYSTPVAEADRVNAEGLIAATQEITAAIENSTKPVL